ncbi:solute carrier family 35 member G1-like [Zerene cesonia]|uniref:solute carrier family 35 member G1-like n=1 Tax=Zerene cesonia TaxID=33412 RepID=UPI0018E54609|nr:solute carrier family 35 member G1-like [Zerene cesonia]XP_038217538.1 solute carrier family 35 member G1-like [Zerene cesonia]XP_038217539.1 solute carrier family 35 member G1-like [Zerene cesonia]
MTEHVELQHLVDLSTGSGDETLPNLLENKRPLIKRCPYLGLLLATLSSLFFSLCSVIVKSLVNIDPMQLAMFRFIGVLLPTIPIVIYTEQPIFPQGKRILLILRSVVGTVGLMLSFYAFRNMPLADASVIVFSVPVFVALFARVFLKEPCGIWNTISIILTLLGVILITHPPFLFGSEQVEINQNYNSLRGAVAAFVSTIFGANAYVLLRVLKGLHFSVIMTNFGAIAILQTLFYSFIFGILCMPNCGTERFLVVCLALFSYLGQILLTMSLQMEQAGPVAIARSADIVFAFLWQVMFFDEIPSKYSVCGAVLVLSSVLLVGIRKWALALPAESHLRKMLGVFAQ